jgi:hypothetical protein
MAFDQIPHAIMRNDRKSALGECHHVVIKAFESEGVKVGKIASDMQLGDLTFSARKILASRHPAIKQKQACMSFLACPDGKRIGRQSARLGNDAANGTLFFGTDLDTPTQLLDMHADHKRRLVQRLSEIAVNLGYTRSPFQKAFYYNAKAGAQTNSGE